MKTQDQSGASLPESPGSDLWCMHVSGPDKVHARRSKEHAEATAKVFNDWANKWAEENGHPGRNPASAQRWPHDAASHAEDLKIEDELLNKRPS